MSIPNMLPVFTLTPPVSIPSDTNIAFSPRPDGHLLELSQGIYRDITRSDAIRFKEDFRTLTGIDKLDTSYDISSLFREEFTEST